MKRYTGQQALYEAISRSRAKAKHGSILERFLPEVSKQENPAGPEGPVRAEPTETAPAAPTPATKEPARPTVEKDRPREPAVVREVPRLRRPATTVAKPDVPAEKPAAPTAKSWFMSKIRRPTASSGPAQTWWRLKPVQLNAGRVEISVPYHVGVAVVLVVLLVILGAFRIGQKLSGAKASEQVTQQDATAETTLPKGAQVGMPTASAAGGQAAASQGDHWIVVRFQRQRTDLDDIKDFFTKNGIDLTVVSLADARKAFAERQLNTAVLPKGDGFLLVTSSLFNNPENSGTDGYAMKLKIIEVGKKYRAAAPKFFGDAYGMKISKVGQ